MAERVHVTGFLPFAGFEAAIAACDLCLNLRYPTAGETSASLLRVLAAGRPAIVSDYAQFAELPAAVALRVPLGDEEPAALAALLRGPARGARAARRDGGGGARATWRASTIRARAAAAVVAACGELGELAPPAGDARRPSPSRRPPRASPGATCRASSRWPAPSSPGRRGSGGGSPSRLANRGAARWLAGERGPGGVALVVKLFAGPTGEDDLLAGRRWLALPRDLEPGEETTLTTEVRRPPGPPGAARLWIEPHLFGGLGFSKLGGPLWAREI